MVECLALHEPFEVGSELIHLRGAEAERPHEMTHDEVPEVGSHGLQVVFEVRTDEAVGLLPWARGGQVVALGENVLPTGLVDDVRTLLLLLFWLWRGLWGSSGHGNLVGQLLLHGLATHFCRLIKDTFFK